MRNSAHRRWNSRRIPVFLLLSVPFLLPACKQADEAASVSGSVHYQGAPLPKGKITFRSTGKDRTMQTADILKGKFAFAADDGLIAADYEIVIIAMRKSKRPKKRFETLEGENKSDKVEDEQYIPEKYNNQTELKATLKPGENTGSEFEFKLSRG